MQRLLATITLCIISIFSYSQIENVVFTLNLKNGDVITGTTDNTEVLGKNYL